MGYTTQNGTRGEEDTAHQDTVAGTPGHTGKHDLPTVPELAERRGVAQNDSDPGCPTRAESVILPWEARWMRLGLVLPMNSPDGGALTGESFVAAVRDIERAGFDSLWAFDAIGRGFIIPDPLIGLSVAANVTERIEVGTGILQVPLRQPVELAHLVLTAHLLCHGRLVLGVGAGSTPDDFAAVDVDFDSRFVTFRKALETMRTLWQGEMVGAANLTPWPQTLGGPPLLVGSWSGSKWVQRAAKEYDGWIASGAKTSFSALADGIGRFRAAGGKRALVTNIVVDLTRESTPMPDDGPFHLQCSPAEASRRLSRLAEIGFDDAVLVSRHVDVDSLAGIRALLPR